MFQLVSLLFAVLLLTTGVVAQSSTSLSPAQITHVITVSNNHSATDGSAVFTPNVVNASLGETVLFNFTQGNHSATQSTFASPCVPAHITNVTINGFDTGLRPTNNGTAITNYIIIMNPDIVNSTLWFYDENTCAIGGVGVINAGNVTKTWQPYDAFVRNARRLNGSHPSSVASAAPTSTDSSSGGSGSNSSSGSSGSNTHPSSGTNLQVPIFVTASLVALGGLLAM